MKLTAKRGVRHARHETKKGHSFMPCGALMVSYLGHLSQAPGVRVLVEEDLVGHFLPDLSLGPLLLSPKKKH